MRAVVRAPLERIEALQTERLRALLADVYARTPYYRELMQQAGLKPEDVRFAKDLCRLPVTDIETLRSLPEEHAGPPLEGPYEIRYTGGTSGGPGAPVVISLEEAVERALITIRGEIENGYRIWKRQAFVDPPPHRDPVWYKRFGILKSEYVSRFDPLPSQLARLQAFRPFRLSGQPSGLEQLANYAAAEGSGELRPSLIHTLGERLRPATRTLLEKVFGAPVFDRYGATEVGIIGWECEQQSGYHLNCDHLIVECVDGKGPVEPGLPGSIVVTNLASRLRPMIRVDLGDMASMGEGSCPCGRSLPLLAGVLGRRSEFLQHPGTGGWLAPHWVEQKMGDVPGVRDYRLVQEATGEIALKVVADSADAIGAMTVRVYEVLGDQVELAVEQCSEISTGSAGKTVRVARRARAEGLGRGSDG